MNELTQPSAPADAELDCEAIAAGIRGLTQTARLSSHKNANSIRSQFHMTGTQAALFKLTTLAVSVVARRPVAGATVLRLALVRLARDVNAALKDEALAAEIRRDMAVARGAK